MRRGVQKRRVAFRKPKVYRYAIFSEGTGCRPYNRGPLAVNRGPCVSDLVLDGL